MSYRHWRGLLYVTSSWYSLAEDTVHRSYARKSMHAVGGELEDIILGEKAGYFTPRDF